MSTRKIALSDLTSGGGAIVGMILCWKCKLVELFQGKGLLR